MNTEDQQPPLPTLRPGGSHAESLIEAAIQGHASTREAMRWLVRQLVPHPSMATQAEVTDEQIKEAAVKAVKDGKLSWLGFEKDDQDKYTIPVISKQHYQFARAILALRPERVPMTEKQIGECIGEVMLNSSYGTHHFGWAIELARAIEAHHGISAQAKKETP